MSTRRRIGLVLIFGIIAAALAYYTLQSREPVYQGRRLSAWLDELTAGMTGPVSNGSPAVLENRHRKAKEALRAIGTNALPQLVKYLPEKPGRGGFRDRIKALLEK